MDFSLELGVFLALLCAFVTTLACCSKHRGATAAPPVDLRRPLASAARLLRLRWLAMKSIAHDEIVGEIHRATDGDATLSPWLARFVLDTLGGTPSAEPSARIDPELDVPTACEQEVLLLIASGYTYEEIAARLHLSVETVETHVSSVLRKLERTDRDGR